MKQLPTNPNLDHLRTQAKDLLRLLRTSDPEVKLHQAQFQLAQEYGFSSWPSLVEEVASRNIAGKNREEILEIFESPFAQGNENLIRKTLRKRPELAQLSTSTLLIALDYERLSKIDFEMSPSGNYPLAPIARAAVSPIAKQQPEAYVETLRLLLAKGADPNTSFIHPQYPDSPLSILYAAVGLANNPAACQLLLESGADPNDNESLYHSTEHRDHVCTKLLLQYGARVTGCNALLRMLDFEDLEGLEILLPFADINGEHALVHALVRGRSETIIRRLISAGADPDLPHPHGLTGRTLARERGILLDEQTSGSDHSPEEQLLASCWTGNIQESTRLSGAQKDLDRRQKMALVDASWAGYGSLIDAFFAGGFTHQHRGKHGETPLHAACFSGAWETVTEILKYAPPLSDKENEYSAIPIQWAMYASGQAEPSGPEQDWLKCVELLIAAGSPPPESLFGTEAIQTLLIDRWPDLDS